MKVNDTECDMPILMVCESRAISMLFIINIQCLGTSSRLKLKFSNHLAINSIVKTKHS